MLYTSVPLERVYTNFREKNQVNQDQNIEYKEVMLPHGRVVTRREGQNYIIEKISSTDMSDYLNSEYTPGKTISE